MSAASSPHERFESRVRRDDPNGCWIWTGSTVNGYGQMYYQARPQRAHRVPWMLFRGPTHDLNVLHHCDVPACVNPDHLFLGTQLDNHRDMEGKGRGRPPRGSRHFNASLSERKVAAMRLLSADGVPPVELVRMFRVSFQTVARVIRRESWRHVPEQDVA